MILFTCLTILVLIGQYFTNILSYITGKIYDSYERNKKLKDEIFRLETELSNISMVDEFAKHARLKRKINVLEDEYKNSVTTAKNKKVKIRLSYGLIGQLILGIFTSTIVYYFWNEPLLKFNEKWVFPLQIFLSFNVKPGELGILPWFCIVKSCVSALKK